MRVRSLRNALNSCNPFLFYALRLQTHKISLLSLLSLCSLSRSPQTRTQRQYALLFEPRSSSPPLSFFALCTRNEYVLINGEILFSSNHFFVLLRRVSPEYPLQTYTLNDCLFTFALSCVGDIFTPLQSAQDTRTIILLSSWREKKKPKRSRSKRKSTNC